MGCINRCKCDDDDWLNDLYSRCLCFNFCNFKSSSALIGNCCGWYGPAFGLDRFHPLSLLAGSLVLEQLYDLGGDNSQCAGLLKLLSLIMMVLVAAVFSKSWQRCPLFMASFVGQRLLHGLGPEVAQAIFFPANGHGSSLMRRCLLYGFFCVGARLHALSLCSLVSRVFQVSGGSAVLPSSGVTPSWYVWFVSLAICAPALSCTVTSAWSWCWSSASRTWRSSLTTTITLITHSNCLKLSRLKLQCCRLCRDWLRHVPEWLRGYPSGPQGQLALSSLKRTRVS